MGFVLNRSHHGTFTIQGDREQEVLDQSHLNGSSLVVVTSAGLAFYGLALTIYRIWFHPLAGFPGPKLAAATGWYQTYYEVMTYGKLSFKLAELHTRYGMAFPTCMLGC